MAGQRLPIRIIAGIILVVAFIGIAFAVIRGSLVTTGQEPPTDLDLTARTLGVLCSLAMLPVFWLASSPVMQRFQIKGWMVLALIIVAGTAIRFFLATETLGNYDMRSFQLVARIVAGRGNVYATTGRYNYSPAWFWILHFLDQLFRVPLNVTIRLFLTAIDLVIVVLLIGIARHENLPVARTVWFFYLNPVSFLITGYHGQFENVTIALLLGGILAYLTLKVQQPTRAGVLWLMATLATIVKQNVVYELLIVVNYLVKRFWVKIALIALSGVIFLVLLLPYWSGANAGQGILNNVLFYTGTSGDYGITTIADVPILRILLIAAILVYPFLLITDDLIERCLLGVLFFLTFTPGFGPQYAVLPIAFGALRPSKSFLAFTTLTTLWLLGALQNMYWSPLAVLNVNLVWIGAAFWFITANFYVAFRPDGLVDWTAAGLRREAQAWWLSRRGGS